MTPQKNKRKYTLMTTFRGHSLVLDNLFVFKSNSSLKISNNRNTTMDSQTWLRVRDSLCHTPLLDQQRVKLH